MPNNCASISLIRKCCKACSTFIKPSSALQSNVSTRPINGLMTCSFTPFPTQPRVSRSVCSISTCFRARENTGGDSGEVEGGQTRHRRHTLPASTLLWPAGSDAAHANPRRRERGRREIIESDSERRVLSGAREHRVRGLLWPLDGIRRRLL